MALSSQPTVLQVVILRDSLLVGTEVFVPGTYTVGSDPGSDLKLDDPSVLPQHALLYFQNGRAAIQDTSQGVGLYVNGHRISACEIRSVDEVICGPFMLKVRVLSKQQQPQRAPTPPPHLAALLSSPQQVPQGARQTLPAPAYRPQQVPQQVPVGYREQGPEDWQELPEQEAMGATQIRDTPLSFRPAPAAPASEQPTPPAPVGAPRRTPMATPAMRPQAEAPRRTPMATPAVMPQAEGPRRTPMATPAVRPQAEAPRRTPMATPAVTGQPAYGNAAQQTTVPSARRRTSSSTAIPSGAPQQAAVQLKAPTPLKPETLPTFQIEELSEQPEPAQGGEYDTEDSLDTPVWPVQSERPTAAPIPAPGKGPAQLFLELYWVDTRREARSFAPGRKPVQAFTDQSAPMPLWGFELDKPFHLADSLPSGGWRLFIPPGSSVERAAPGDLYRPLSTLESEGSRRYVTLREGVVVRVSQGPMSLVAYAAPRPQKEQVSPLLGVPWLALGTFGALAACMGAFLVFMPKQPEPSDFTPKGLPPVALRLLAPESKKKEEAQKKLEKIKQQAPAKKPVPDKQAAPKPQVARADKPPPKAAAPESSALKALAKLSAAGPAANDVLAAVDKLGSGPGSKFAKASNYKLSGLIGKAPIANAGTGTFGLGGGGRGGGATLGAELLRGKGGGGIGALGAGGVGKGAVGGTVTRATSRAVAASQGSIDREAVARVINSHLAEVHSCYERALIKDPGLAGKVVLEWTIGPGGRVTAAKTKSSTLRNASVESCILNSLKGWTFPSPQGGIVIITYPFMFNSVGY
jgi:outer membrane biosynthesis protein TonB